MSKLIEGYEVPDYTNPQELSADLQDEYNKSWSQPSLMDKVRNVFDALTPEMPTEPPNITWEGMKNQVVKQYEDLKTTLNTAVNGPDIYAENYTGDYKQERMDAVNKLVSQYGLTSGAGSAAIGGIPAGSTGAFVAMRRGLTKLDGMSETEADQFIAKSMDRYAELKKQFKEKMDDPANIDLKAKFVDYKMLQKQYLQDPITTKDSGDLFKLKALKYELMPHTPEYKLWEESQTPSGGKLFMSPDGPRIEYPDNPQINMDWMKKNEQAAKDHDVNGKIINTKSWEGKLTDVFSNEAMDKAYPELKDVNLKILHDTDGSIANQLGIYGQFNPDTNELLLLGDPYSAPRTGPYGTHRAIPGSRDLRDLLSVYLHESGHKIQDVSGWASGGNPTTRRQLLDKIRTDEWDLLGERAGSSFEFYAKNAPMIHRLEEDLQTKKDFLGDLRDDELYNLLYGEQESRALQSRWESELLDQGAYKDVYTPEFVEKMQNLGVNFPPRDSQYKLNYPGYDLDRPTSVRLHDE